MLNYLKEAPKELLVMICSGISIHISVQVSQYIPGFHKKKHICERKATMLALVFLGTGIIKVFSFNELLTMCTLPR